MFDGDFGHADERGGMLHALCVHGWAEDGDCRVIGCAEGFETLVALLTVVETGCHAMNA